MAQPTSPNGRQQHAAVVVLGLTIVTSAIVRSLVAWQHSVPRLFPDEYIYAALSRSIGHGQLQIRGATVHFPGILEPVLAAPIWRLFPAQTAYHLVQVENAVAVSLAAIPIYVIARSMRLTQWYSVVAAIYALLIPELVLVAYTSSDAVAYPLALGAIAFALAAFQRPTKANQVGFLIFASLATLTRVEYFALVPAYIVGAVTLEGREVWRRHRVALLALVPAGVLALVAALGYYEEGLRASRFDSNYIKWFFVQMFLLTLEAGVVIVPGAVAALVRPRGRRETGFAVLSGTLAFLLLVAATQHAADSLEFKERYLFVLLALIPVAFGIYLEQGRPNRYLVCGLAAAIGIAAARLPLSEYAASTFKTDSQFLFAVSFSQKHLGTANSSLAIGLLATLLAAAAAGFAFRGHKAVPIGAAVASVAVAGAVATYVDIQTTRTVRADLPGQLNWVDQAADGGVTAIETPVSLKQDLLYQLYWNSSIRRELLLGSAIPTDAFRAPRLHIDRTGVVKAVTGNVLFSEFGTTAWLADAERLARVERFTLWRTNGPMRLRLVVSGRFWDRWLSANGRLRAWPIHPRAGVRVQFRLSLPRGWPQGTSVKLGDKTFILHPGEFADIACRTRGTDSISSFSADATHVTKDFRQLSVRLTGIKISDQRSTSSSVRSCAGTR